MDKIPVWVISTLVYVIGGAALFGLLFLGGCSTSPMNNKPLEKNYYDYPLQCPVGLIEYCEGRNPNNMKCQCVRENDFEWFMRQEGLA